MAHAKDDSLLRAANEACQVGRPQDAQTLLDQWAIGITKSTSFQASSPGEGGVRQLQLERAAAEGHSRLVGFLLDQSTEITSPVLLAAHSGKSAKVFQELLDHGWDINKDPNMTSLNCAVSSNNEKLVDWHLSHGADPNIHTGAGGTPLERAAFQTTLHIVKSLVTHGAKLHDTEALIAAAANKNRSREPIRIMEYLLDQGVDINYGQKLGNPMSDTLFRGTALHRAVESEDAERVQLLLQRGANPDIKGEHGLTPLEAAERSQFIEMAEILRKQGRT